MSEARQTGWQDPDAQADDPARAGEQTEGQAKGLALAHQVASAVGPVAPFLSMATYAGLAVSDLGTAAAERGTEDGDENEGTGSR
ncbi:hypothetical protein ABZ639_14345 [Saccharomonospora sp. NPDC006951]